MTPPSDDAPVAACLPHAQPCALPHAQPAWPVGGPWQEPPCDLAYGRTLVPPPPGDDALPPRGRLAEIAEAVADRSGLRLRLLAHRTRSRDLLWWAYEAAVGEADRAGLLWTAALEQLTHALSFKSHEDGSSRPEAQLNATLDAWQRHPMALCAERNQGYPPEGVAPEGLEPPTARLDRLTPWIASVTDPAVFEALFRDADSHALALRVARFARCLTPALMDLLHRRSPLWASVALAANPDLPAACRERLQASLAAGDGERLPSDRVVRTAHALLTAGAALETDVAARFLGAALAEDPGPLKRVVESDELSTAWEQLFAHPAFPATPEALDRIFLFLDCRYRRGTMDPNPALHPAASVALRRQALVDAVKNEAEALALKLSGDAELAADPTLAREIVRLTCELPDALLDRWVPRCPDVALREIVFDLLWGPARRHTFAPVRLAAVLPRMTPQALASLGDDTWLALLDHPEAGVRESAGLAIRHRPVAEGQAVAGPAEGPDTWAATPVPSAFVGPAVGSSETAPETAPETTPVRRAALRR